MAKEAMNAVVFRTTRKADVDGFTQDPIEIRRQYACVDQKIHCIIYSELVDCYEYEVDEMGYHTTGEWQELLYRHYDFGPCDGRCRVEPIAKPETVEIPKEVAREIPENLTTWRRAKYYYRKWR